MAQTTATKLGIPAGERAVLMGRPLSDAVALGLADIVTSAGAEASTVVILATESVNDVITKAEAASDAVAAGGRFWIAYQKGASRKSTGDGEPALHRDTLQAALAELGMNGVTLISLNETWSAMRVKTVA